MQAIIHFNDTPSPLIIPITDYSLEECYGPFACFTLSDNNKKYIPFHRIESVDITNSVPDLSLPLEYMHPELGLRATNPHPPLDKPTS